MKKQLLTLLLVLIAGMVSAQDDHKSVTLKPGAEYPETVLTEYCKLYLTANSSYTDKEVNLSVEVENTNDYYILLFGHAYTEKDLKKQRPSIRFDRTSYGATSRNLLTCKGNRDEGIMQIEPSLKCVLNIDGVHAKGAKLELPLYVAKHKPKKFLRKEKYIIMKRAIVTLDIRIESEPEHDETLEQLNDRYDKLMADLKGKTFCPRSAHRPDLERQKEPYTKQIEEMLEEIADVKSTNKWKERTEAYKPYKELKEKLTDLRGLKEYEQWCGSCGSGRPTRVGKSQSHSCNYCNKSLNEVRRFLERSYQRLQTGTSKSSVMGTVDALHAAWSGSCPNLKKRKQDDTSGKSGQIDNYYNKIANY